jgi:hypothetical protein
MRLELNLGDAIIIQTHKETIMVQCNQVGFIEVTNLD